MKLTRYNHEKTVGHDEDLHGVDEGGGGQDAAVGDEVADELDVEDCAEPKDGSGTHDEGPVNAPEEELGRDGGDDGVVLDNGEGEPGADGEEHDDGRQRAGDVLCGAGPKGEHGPGLVHEGGLRDDDERQGERVGGEAGVVVAARDLGEVGGPDLVKVAQGGDVVGKEQAGADGAEQQAGDVQEGGGADELGGGREGEDDEEHDDAGAELGAVVHGDADGLVVEGVERRHGHGGGRGAVGEEKGDVAVEPVKGRVGRDNGRRRRRAVHGGELGVAQKGGLLFGGDRGGGKSRCWTRFVYRNGKTWLMDRFASLNGEEKQAGCRGCV